MRIELLRLNFIQIQDVLNTNLNTSNYVVNHHQFILENSIFQYFKFDLMDLVRNSLKQDYSNIIIIITFYRPKLLAWAEADDCAPPNPPPNPG